VNPAVGEFENRSTFAEVMTNIKYTTYSWTWCTSTVNYCKHN